MGGNHIGQQEAMIDLKRTHEGETLLIPRNQWEVESKTVPVSRKTGTHRIGSSLRVCSASVLKIYFPLPCQKLLLLELEM